MAYNDDAVLARLSALNESHDSIATAAQWIMFHRRHADRTVQLWLQRLKDSQSTKRLNLVYLANEIAQQSRIRHKEDFIIALSPVVAEATSIAYKGAPSEVQGKLRRVVDVWKDRAIFEAPIQTAIEARLDELDKSRGSSRPGFGASPFAPASVPPEFSPLVSSHQKAMKLSGPLKATIASADHEFDKHMDPSTEVPSAPVYAARLNGLLKTLANAETAVADCFKARQDLVNGLQKLLDTNRALLDEDQAALTRFQSRREEVESKKQQVEMAIMRALEPSDGNQAPVDGAIGGRDDTETARPEMEALTPPAVESLSPPEHEPLEMDEAITEQVPAGSPEEQTTTMPIYASIPVTANGSNKRRRVDDEDEIPSFEGGDGIDADVAEMLK